MAETKAGKLIIAGLFVVAAYGAFDSFRHREISQPDGVLAPAPPQQTPSTRAPLKFKGQIVDFLADYQIQARVLSTSTYRFDRGANFAPVDLALGWGPMSDSKNLTGLKISQSDRFYFYGWDGNSPLSEDTMRTHSANVHLVPADPIVEKQIKALRAGQVVQLKGHLIRLNYLDGGEWKSSLTREDSGPGACELLWVDFVL